MARGGKPRFQRSARIAETLREIIAEDLVRIGDERLEFVTITGIEVDNELNRAHVFFDSLTGEEGDDEIIEALDEHRRELQSSINRQIHAKKTPVLDFRPDLAIRSAERIDEILREDRARMGERGDEPASDNPGSDSPASDNPAGDGDN